MKKLLFLSVFLLANPVKAEISDYTAKSLLLAVSTGIGIFWAHKYFQESKALANGDDGIKSQRLPSLQDSHKQLTWHINSHNNNNSARSHCRDQVFVLPMERPVNNHCCRYGSVQKAQQVLNSLNEDINNLKNNDSTALKEYRKVTRNCIGITQVATSGFLATTLFGLNFLKK